MGASALGQSLRELRDGAVGSGLRPMACTFVFTSPGIWVMDSQGNNPQKILAFGENESAMNAEVRWSPDGRRLAYIALVHGELLNWRKMWRLSMHSRSRCT